MDSKEILQFFTESLRDGILSSAEKKALKAGISESKPSKRELDWLRSQIFDLAMSKVSGFENEKILTWLENANKLILPRMIESANYCKSYFSPGNDCRDAITQLIGTAVSSIDICVFTISDNKISDRIIYAHKKGVSIKILTDDDKTNDSGSDIAMLEKAGIKVKVDNSPSHMHHKFAVIDNKTLLTGSYNWTRSAAVSNQENILVTNDSDAVAQYKNEFVRLWEKMQEF